MTTLREQFEKEFPNKKAVLRSTGTAGLSYVEWLESRLQNQPMTDYNALTCGHNDCTHGKACEWCKVGEEYLNYVPLKLKTTIGDEHLYAAFVCGCSVGHATKDYMSSEFKDRMFRYFKDSHSYLFVQKQIDWEAILRRLYNSPLNNDQLLDWLKDQPEFNFTETEAQETDRQNRYTEIVCKRLLEWNENGIFGSEAMQRCAELIHLRVDWHDLYSRWLMFNDDSNTNTNVFDWLKEQPEFKTK